MGRNINSNSLKNLVNIDVKSIQNQLKLVENLPLGGSAGHPGAMLAPGAPETPKLSFWTPWGLQNGRPKFDFGGQQSRVPADLQFERF